MENIVTPSNVEYTKLGKHEPIVEKLKTFLDDNDSMRFILVASLKSAKILATKNLDKALYEAINNEYQGNGWPESIEAYLDYLDQFVRMIPNESNDPSYPDAWKSNGRENGYNKKVYDLLCHFYWLVNQKMPVTSQTMQSFDVFSDWLIAFAQEWGSFLDTEASLTVGSLQSFKYNPMYNYPLFAKNSHEWKTFNQFFYRQFNDANAVSGISPLRPIADPDHNTTIVSPADCTYKQDYPIDFEGNILKKNGSQTTVRLKQTHEIGSVDELLAHSVHTKDFYSGTFVHYFLSPFDYHRFHAPVSGEVLEIRSVPGRVYLDVKIKDDGQWDAPDGADNGYQFTQQRGLVVIDAGREVGKVAVLPVGMCQVSGVDMYTHLDGQDVVKGQEFGKFSFGGSDIIMLFEKEPEELYLFKEDPGHNPIHFQYGQPAVYWNK